MQRPPIMDPVPQSTDIVAAGPFADWLAKFRASLQGTAGMDVPCGGCVGCCVSGYAVWLRPTDSRALARIPVKLLSVPPGLPEGNRLMQAAPDGSCPMLAGGKCSIYADRPQTCVDYDCRVFAAAGVAAGGDDRSVINRRVRAWRFDYPSEEDRAAHAAVQAGAAFIRNHADCFPGRVPSAASGIAVLAVKIYKVFLDPEVGRRDPMETARAIIAASRAFDEGQSG